MIRRLLIANRGEIAIRIARACRELGIKSVAVFSAIDAGARHVAAADAAYEIGGAAASDSYLSIPHLIEAARKAGVDAVHPGYGFLSENAAFARSCEDAGFIFVGPPAHVIERMGSKIAARELVQAAGVAVVPGMTPSDQSTDGISRAAELVGYPVLLKASAGGGGKGMRLVTEPAGLSEAAGAAAREALHAFGDATLYVERYLTRPRHVEVQIFGDAHGQVVHLFERECTIQRRHQKVIEETPSPALTPRLRDAMGRAAVAIATQAAYRNAGTIEFLVEGGEASDASDAVFYFLEMNTRLQVEHPITESVLGVDLVHAQLAIAGGAPLPWSQHDLAQRGHALECRIYAEDPERGFLPQAGSIALYRAPAGPGIRVDSGVGEGSEVPVQYDPLLAKLIASGETREVAISRARVALADYAVLGIRTNIPFLGRVLAHPRFRSGDLDTSFIETEMETLLQPAPPPAEAIAAAAYDYETAAGRARPDTSTTGAERNDPWTTLKSWRGFD